VPISGIRLSDWLHRRLTDARPWALGIERPQDSIHPFHWELAGAWRRHRWPLSSFALRYSLLCRSRSHPALPSSSPIAAPFPLCKLTRSKGPSLHRHYPASSVPLPLSDAQMVRNPFRSRSQVAALPPPRASPTDRRLPSWHAVLTTPVVPPVPMVIGLARSRAGFFRMGSAFPALAPGRHHIGPFGACSSFTRVTACQVARPPFRGLCREVPIRPVSQPNRPPAIESNHQLFEWVLPPMVICPFRAHAKARPPFLALANVQAPDADREVCATCYSLFK